MDLCDPTRAVTPTLDGPVLAVLASAGRPLTVGEVAAQAARGSEIGIRRSLARLVEQGIVRATLVGRNRVHELNRDHIAAPIAVALGGLRIELWRRLRDVLVKWKVRPVYAWGFGSAARGDGGPESDIDVLLVHPPFPGEKRPSRSVSPRSLLRAVVLEATAPRAESAAARWRRQVDDLRRLVQGWTGNPLQVVDLSVYEWADRGRAVAALFKEIERDGVVLFEPGMAMTPKQEKAT
ncbi:MAG: nucleotidyltransferase domain-containing protein [Acidimicrobiales bacterium]